MTAVAFVAPVFVFLTSPDVVTLSEASRAAPEVVGAIAVPVVVLVLTRRAALTWLGILLTALGRPHGRRGVLGSAAATLGPVAVAGLAWIDFAALLALLSGALPELIALAVLGAIVSLTWRHLHRLTLLVVRVVRAHRP